MAVELRNSLVRSAGRPLPATLLFDYPSLTALADYLARVWELDVDTTNASDAATKEPTKFVESVATLSDEQAEALLLEELASSAIENRA